MTFSYFNNPIFSRNFTYKSGGFVYQNWDWTVIYNPLSFPLRSLTTFLTHWDIKVVYESTIQYIDSLNKKFTILHIVFFSKEATLYFTLSVHQSVTLWENCDFLACYLRYTREIFSKDSYGRCLVFSVYPSFKRQKL